MAIGDRLKRAVRNRREKAGEVTGKKKYSVFGPAGGRARGTRWVRGKKKKAEPKAEAPQKKVAAPAPQKKEAAPAPQKKVTEPIRSIAPKTNLEEQPKEQPREQLESEKTRPATGTHETGTQAGGKTPIKDKPVIPPPPRKSVRELPYVREGEPEGSPTVPEDITSIGHPTTPSGLVTPSAPAHTGPPVSDLHGIHPDDWVFVAPTDLPDTPPMDLISDVTLEEAPMRAGMGGPYIDKTVPQTDPEYFGSRLGSNEHLREFFTPLPPEASLDEEKSPMPRPPERPRTYTDILRDIIAMYLPETPPLPAVLPDPPAQSRRPRRSVTTTDAVDPYSGSARNADEQAVIDAMASEDAGRPSDALFTGSGSGIDINDEEAIRDMVNNLIFPPTPAPVPAPDAGTKWRGR
jgi:hypothetical protein